MGRKSTSLAAGAQDAVAGHDDREWVVAQRPPYFPRGGRVAEAPRDLAVGQGFANRDFAGDRVDFAIERGQAVHVEVREAKVGRLAAQETRHRGDHFGDARRESCLTRARESADEAGAGFVVAAGGKLHPHDAARAPRDAAAADGGVEKRDSLGFHGWGRL